MANTSQNDLLLIIPERADIIHELQKQHLIRTFSEGPAQHNSTR